MGNNTSIENVSDINISPKNVYICFTTERYKDQSHVFVMRNTSSIYHIDSLDLPKNLFYKDRDEIILGYVETLDNAKDLYSIQDGNEFIDFRDLDVRDADDNLAEVLKLPKEYVIDIQTIEINRPPKTFDGSFRDYIKSIYEENDFVDSMEGYYLPIFPSKDSKLNTKKIRSTVNKWKGYTYKDFTFPTNNLYFIHNTYNYNTITESGYLCNMGDCEGQMFRESTGVYDITKTKQNPREQIEEQPGIYFTQFKYPEYMMRKDSLFNILEYNSWYGDIGFIFNVEEIFRKYRVNLKADQSFGYGPEVDISSYFRLTGDEAIARANKIPLSMVKAIRISFGYSELRFIYENFSEDNFTLQDVINIYKKNRDKHWYIRKSNLLKVIDSYGKKTLPFIIATKRHRYVGEEIDNYGTEFDMDSDPELMN